MEEKKSSREVAQDYILSEIRAGNWKTGDKVLTERKLSEKLGISRVPIREAISTLTTMGILEVRQGDGTFVAAYKPDTLSGLIKNYEIFDRSIVEEIFETRVCLEADAAKLAALHRTKEDVKYLGQALKIHEAALLDYYAGRITAEEMMEYDGVVHYQMAAASHNNFMVQMIEAMRRVTVEKGIFREENTVNHNHFKESALLHRKIARAIEQGEAETAYQYMQQHIRTVQRAVAVKKNQEEFI